MTEEKKLLLISRAKNGDIAAFEQLVQLHYEKLNSFALNITAGNYALAEDILQEAMIKAFLSIKKLKSGSTFSSWLWRIIKNEFLQFVRKPDNRKMVFAEDLPFSDVGIEEESEKNLIKEEQEKNLRKIIPPTFDSGSGGTGTY